MSEPLDLTDAMRVLCSVAGLEPHQVRDVEIHNDFLTFELVDGSLVTFLREDEDGRAA